MLVHTYILKIATTGKREIKESYLMGLIAFDYSVRNSILDKVPW